MTEIVWPCGGHKYDDVGVVCGACHDAEVSRLKAQLASMTKRAEAAEAKLAIEHEANQHDPVRLKLIAAEAKLAMATAGIRNGLDNLVALDDDPYPQTCIAAAKFCLADTLRAIGVEPGEVGR